MSPASGAKPLNGVEHEVARVVPRDRPAHVLQRRVAVVVAQPRQAEQPRLERVEALRDVVAGDDRVDEAVAASSGISLPRFRAEIQVG